MDKYERIVSAVCLALFLGCLTYICNYYYKQYAAQEVYDSVEISADATESGDADDSQEENVDFDQLWSINEDVIAYIKVPGTDVSYPVLQSADDDEYYLDHTIERTEGLPGSIYIESWQSSDFSDLVTVVYGHNMKNGTMFASLHNFEEKEFFDGNNNITLYVPGEEEPVIYNYQIYCAVVYDNRYIPNSFDTRDESSVMEFVDSLDVTGDSRNYFNEEMEIEEGDKLLVLSTCISNDDYRYLVIGVWQGEVQTEEQAQ